MCVFLNDETPPIEGYNGQQYSSDCVLGWSIKQPGESKWVVRFGPDDGTACVYYYPTKQMVPNWFVRWCMRVCLGFTWVKKDEQKNN